MVDGMIEWEKTSSPRAWRSALVSRSFRRLSVVSTGVEVFLGRDRTHDARFRRLHARGGLPSMEL